MVAGKFQEHELTPAIVKVAPPAAAKVTYQCGAEVNFGADLTPLQVKDEPAVVWPADAAHLYTLCMTDPDAPNRKEPVNGQILHWLVVNIPGTDISKGQVLAAYRGSGPSVLSGKHRYAFFVYQQPSRIEPDEKPIDKTSVEGRRNFKLQVYSEKYHLGNPIAGNFFQAEADDYSAELHKDRNKKMADEKYAKHEIVPQIIRTPPADIMRVKYNTGVEACLGEDLAPRQVKDQPDIQFKADEHALYTLIMTDPDAPSRKDPSRGEVKHWLVVNIPGNKVSQGDVLAEFIGSGPPLGSGKHRYLFVAYKQTGRIVSEESPVDKYTVDGRFNFKTQAFAEKHHLGDAVAGNFYQAEYDDYVPELHAQFKKPEK